MNNDNLELLQRKNHRLKNYDYGNYGYYFITICTANRMNILCDPPENVGSDALVAPVNLSSFIPTEIGKKVVECWNNIALLNENIEVDKFVLMPNHIHGIIIIKNNEIGNPQEKKYGFEIAERRGRRSLPGLVKDFKSVTTRYYKKMFKTDLSLWQESFYDEIIKSQEHYNRIWEYISTNCEKWAEDCYNESIYHA